MMFKSACSIPRGMCCAMLLYGLAVAGPSLAEDKAAATAEHADHSAHKAAASKSDVRRSEARYRVPAVKMVDQDGNKVVFNKEIDDGRPVILNFVYTSCTAICPVMTHIFVQVQNKLGKSLDKVHMVSVSIDPEYDTPARLLEFEEENGMGCQWDFYTGTSDASVAVQKAFEAYQGDKMNHLPLTLMRASPGKPWVRLDGFASPDMIVKEFRAITK